MPVVRLMLALVALSIAWPAYATQQLVPTKTLLVKNPLSGARKVLWKVKDTAATLVGDPTADGAALHIVLTPGGDQCVMMPASGWSAIGTIGFKYRDATLANGPVKVALIKKTPSGTFLLKALLKNGGPTSITVTPGDPTTTYATNFTLGTGDEYCGGTATATPSPNDGTTFKISNDAASGGCAASCSATTSSTTPPSTSSTTSTSTSSTTSMTALTCGAQVGGFCWFLGAAGDSCDTVCGNQGAVYDTATASYAGTGGNDENCEAVLNAFPGDPTFNGSLSCFGVGVGCVRTDIGGVRCTDVPTNGGDSFSTFQRACACQ